MAKKLNAEGIEEFDGEPVEEYQAKLNGIFPMSDTVGAEVATDDLVTFIVTARVEAPNFKYNKKTGALQRLNTLRIQDAYAISADEARYLLDNMGEEVEGVNAGLIEDAAPTTDTQPSLIDDEWNVQ